MWCGVRVFCLLLRVSGRNNRKREGVKKNWEKGKETEVLWEIGEKEGDSKRKVSNKKIENLCDPNIGILLTEGLK